MTDANLWAQLTFAEQMGQLGSELKRARDAEDEEDFESRNEFLDSSLNFLEFTLKDIRYHKHVGELEHLHTAIMAWRISKPTWKPQAILNYCMSFLLDDIK